MRKICVITNNRADYSRLKTLLKALKDRSDVELLLFVVGSHLLHNYGYTIDEIEKDGFNVTYKMHTEIDGRIPVTMAKSTGAAIMELSSAFYNFKPDMVVVHGDRFEAMAAAIAASFMNIFVAHIQGGEVTGTIDGHIRHSITKLSHLHFPSTEDAEERIIKMGERADMVFNFGCPSADLLLETPLISFDDLKKEIFKYAKKEDWKNNFNENFFMVVQHPVTTEFSYAKEKIMPLFDALNGFNHNVLMLWPNIDAGSETMVLEIKKFEKEKNGRIGLFPHFPFDLFVNIMRHAKVVIGNSSAGIREACYFGKPVVNIGTRQEGRQRPGNVIDVDYDAEQIKSAINRHLEKGKYKPEFAYGKGNAGKNIADILATINISQIQKKITF
ncbi:MAG: UDP-N-acetylglucosamine 2-epimerase [Patescibacteria group bacterium]